MGQLAAWFIEEQCVRTKSRPALFAFLLESLLVLSEMEVLASHEPNIAVDVIKLVSDRFNL